MALNFINKLAVTFRRRKAARRLGFTFTRASRFKLPAAIQIGKRDVGIRLPTDSGTANGFIDLLLDDCYGLETFANMPPRSILDIGGHAGMFTLAVAARFPGAKIHAYEPNPRMAPFLTHNAAAVGAQAYLAAVAERAGTMNLDIQNESVLTRRTGSGNGVEVPCVAFSEAVARLGGQVDLVKLDCEGGEWPIMNNPDTWRSVKALTMEYHLWAGYSLEQLKQRVCELGFSISACEPQGEDFGLLRASRLSLQND